MRLSAIVLYELTARPIGEEDFKKYDNWREQYEKDSLLIVPNFNDIWTSAKAVRKMRLEEKKIAKGKTPPMENPAMQQNDALIARSAFQNDCFVVTNNVSDYIKLRRFMRFEFMSAEDYFK